MPTTGTARRPADTPVMTNPPDGGPWQRQGASGRIHQKYYRNTIYMTTAGQP